MQLLSTKTSNGQAKYNLNTNLVLSALVGLAVMTLVITIRVVVTVVVLVVITVVVELLGVLVFFLVVHILEALWEYEKQDGGSISLSYPSLPWSYRLPLTCQLLRVFKR